MKMFHWCKKFNHDLSRWNVYNGKNFIEMFSDCIIFNSDLSKWNVRKGEYFISMFHLCTSFDADLSNWDVYKAKEWENFAKHSLLIKYPERIPKKFRSDYL